MNALAVIVNLFLPGIGLILLGRRRYGIPLAFFFCIGLDGMLLAPLLIGGKAAIPFVRAAGILAASVWLWAQVRLFLRIRFLRSPDFVQHQEELFQRGLECYLRDQLPQARQAFASVVALDATDADALLYLGLVCRALGQPALARASLKRCARCDYERKWRWEVEEETRALKEGR